MIATLKRAVTTLTSTNFIRAAFVINFLAILTILPQQLEAKGPEQVIVLPFQINAPDDLSYLANQIASVLAQQLEKDGAVIIFPTEDETAQLLALSTNDHGSLRQFAKKLGASQIVWGSLTMVDQSFSLDARLMQVGGDAPVEQIFVEGQDLENLLVKTQSLGSQISLKLFSPELVTGVQILGNRRIESDAILKVIKTKAGSPYQPSQLSKDIKAIFQMGYFDDVRVDAQSEKDGKMIIFHVAEKPTIRQIKISGNSYLDEDKIRENLTISSGAILNLFKVHNNLDQIRTMYRDKNYYNVKVDYKVRYLDNNQADLDFIIDEGSKLYVTAIDFEGNKAFTAKKLRKEMKTAEKGCFFFLTESGDLKREVLDQDVARLTNYYQNHGFMQVRIGEPQIDIQEKEIHITIKIEEGLQYRVGTVDITGDLLESKAALLSKLSITKEKFISREAVRKDVLTLTDVYADQGYAYAEITPLTKQLPDEATLDITFSIKKKHQVYFEAINISGNTRTRDKVIRRELKVVEQNMFSNKDLQRSIRNLYYLDYFEDIKVDTIKGSADDKMVLDINVAEKGTGSFNFGIGYGGGENGFVNASVTEKNLFGRGQTAELSGLFGSITTEYKLTFIEPWLFDIPLYARATANDQQKNYTGYDRHTRGGGLMFGYQVWDYTNFYIGYNYDISDITLVSTDDPDYYNVPDSIKKLEGSYITSSPNTSLVYDSRDQQFNATRGFKHSISFEYAGLGGDIGFNKLIGQSQVYFPIYKQVIGFFNAKAGYVYQNDSRKFLPDYEKFYLGGVTSLRGFGWHGVAVQEPNDAGELIKVGGNTMVQFNTELNFPLFPSAGVTGLVFYDTGNVYSGDIDLSNLRSTAGLGIRWRSPIAPIQVVYGWVLDQKPGEEPGRLEFSMASSF